MTGLGLVMIGGIVGGRVGGRFATGARGLPEESVFTGCRFQGRQGGLDFVITIRRGHVVFAALQGVGDGIGRVDKAGTKREDETGHQSHINSQLIFHGSLEGLAIVSQDPGCRGRIKLATSPVVK